MSGQLVCEVIDAWPTLQKRGLSERGFHALIAIAEKCHTQTRQGSVPWKHIRAGLYGASKRTAQRAVQDLLTAGVLDVVKPGFGNQYGGIRAPIYRVAPLVDNDTQVTRSTKVDDDTQVTRSTKVDDDKPEVDDDKPGGGSRHPGVPLNGPFNGPINGEGLRQSGTSPDEQHPSNNPPPPNLNGEQPAGPPPRYCPRHSGGTDDDCRACGQARLNYEAWKRKNDERAAARKAAIRKAIDACDDCDDYGRPFKGPLPHCPKHPNFRQLAESTVADPDPIPEPVAGDNRIGPYITAISEAKSIDKGGTA